MYTLQFNGYKINVQGDQLIMAIGRKEVLKRTERGICIMIEGTSSALIW